MNGIAKLLTTDDILRYHENGTLESSLDQLGITPKEFISLYLNDIISELFELKEVEESHSTDKRELEMQIEILDDELYDTQAYVRKLENEIEDLKNEQA